MKNLLRQAPKFTVVFGFLFMCLNTAVADTQTALFLLSQKEGELPSKQVMEQTLGSEAETIAFLSDYRLKEIPPLVGIRAEKLLMRDYYDKEEVQQLLIEDLQSPGRFGLARIIATHLDSLPDDSLRLKLADGVIARGKQEQRFKSIARMLLTSTDPEVKQKAKNSPRVKIQHALQFARKLFSDL